MADPSTPSPRRGGTPIAIIVAVVLVALAAVALLRGHGSTATSTGTNRLAAPTEATPSQAPQASTVPDAQQPASPENGAVGHQGTDNEKGAPQRTPNTTG